MKKTLIIVLAVISLLLTISNREAYAANTTIGLSPSTGSFGKSFKVDLVIDGHGDRFNAAQAKVDVLSNLAIQDLVLGDCNFSSLKTPSTQDPSFTGIIISTYSTKCTVYTLILVPTAIGRGTIT